MKEKTKREEKEITSIFPRFPSPREVVVEKGPSSKAKRIVGEKKYLKRKKKLIPDYVGFPRIFSRISRRRPKFSTRIKYIEVHQRRPRTFVL